MTRRKLTGLLLGLAALLAVGVGLRRDVQANGGFTYDLIRLSDDYMNFNGTETATTALPATGLRIFSKTVAVPAGMNALYITLSATGETQKLATADATTAALLLRCQVDVTGPGDIPSKVCNPKGAVADNSYLKMQQEVSTLKDNNIAYSWCIVIPQSSSPTSHAVEVWLASSNGGRVALEGIHISIDTSDGAGCFSAGG